METKPPIETLQFLNLDTKEFWAGDIISAIITNEKLHKSLIRIKLAGK